MKRLVMIVFIFVFCSSCGAALSLRDLEKKRTKGKYTEVIYTQEWEKVFDAIKYIFRY